MPDGLVGVCLFVQLDRIDPAVTKMARATLSIVGSNNNSRMGMTVTDGAVCADNPGHGRRDRGASRLLE
jgi:hypothetical protein